tara:strand:- start:315 stop:428 length:114 start_codon:yes stop_codon:yes gene_type:complete
MVPVKVPIQQVRVHGFERVIKKDILFDKGLKGSIPEV